MKQGGRAAGVASADVAERPYWVLLSMVDGIGPVWFNRLVDRFGGAKAAWNAPPLELAGIGLEQRAVRSLLDLRARVDAEAEWLRLERLGVDVVTLDDSGTQPSCPRSLIRRRSCT